LVHVSTPNFKGTHADGFHATVRALVETLAEADEKSESGNLKAETASRPIALLPNMVSPADLRHLRGLCSEWGTGVTLVPDYSETLDGPSWADFDRTPAGGTTVAELRALGGAAAAIELGHVLALAEHTAGTHLESKFGVPLRRLGLPIGVRACDELSAAMEAATGREMPRRIALERGRLVDSYVDAHKYLAGKKAVVYGEEDLVAGLAVFLAETGIVPVLCASGGRTKRLADAIFGAAPELRGRTEVRVGSDFGDIESRVAELKPDLMIGSSKGYKLARSLGIPLVRCGFPVHDRIGAQRIRLLGYAGTQEIFDRIVNAVLETKQEDSEIGYAYL
jgi:nitrogenase molybdenum-iron protein NifN